MRAGRVMALFAAGLVGVGGWLMVNAEPRLGPADGWDLPGADPDRVKVGEPAPDFTLVAYSGEVVTLSDFENEKNVVLVFYRGHW